MIWSIEDIRRRGETIKQELSTWRKCGWGFFLGTAFLASALGQYAVERLDGSSGRLLLGGLISSWTGIAILVAYYWRKHVLYKNFFKEAKQFMKTLPEEEEKEASSVLLRI